MKYKMKNQMKSSLLAIVCGLSSLTPAAEARSSKNSNPALLYWQAAAELPALTDAKARELREVADGKVGLKADLIEESDFEPTMTFLHKAVASEAPCEWGLAWEEGLEMRTPHLAKMREFSVIVLVLAEAKFANHEAAAGIDLLMMAHHIARDTGAAPLVISVAIQNALERRAIATAARHCLTWDAAMRNDYAARLKTLPDLTPLHQGLASEFFWVNAWEEELEENFEKAIKKSGFGLVANGEQVKEPEQFKEMIAAYREKHAEAMVILKKTGDARRAGVAEFEKELAAAKSAPRNLLSSLLMPALKGLVRSEDRTTMARIMLESVLAHGPEITVKDVEGTPFRLLRNQGALELKSDQLEFALKF